MAPCHQQPLGEPRSPSTLECVQPIVTVMFTETLFNEFDKLGSVLNSEIVRLETRVGSQVGPRQNVSEASKLG